MGCSSCKPDEISGLDSIENMTKETLLILECIIFSYISQKQMKLAIKIFKVRKVLTEYFDKNKSDREKIQRLYNKLLCMNQIIYENEIEKEKFQLRLVYKHFQRVFKRAYGIPVYSSAILNRTYLKMKETDRIYIIYREVLRIFNLGIQKNLSTDEIISSTFNCNLSQEENKVISQICKGSTHFLNKPEQKIDYLRFLKLKELTGLKAGTSKRSNTASIQETGRTKSIKRKTVK